MGYAKSDFPSFANPQHRHLRHLARAPAWANTNTDHAHERILRKILADMQSYRPGGERYAPPSASTYRPARSPPPRDSYRSTRSPPRRPPPADSYVPSSSRAPRPRSRSPPYRRRSRSPRGPYIRPESDTWRARPRSPPRRDYSPPRARDYSPPPRRDYSPPRRDYSPPPRREYTPRREYSPRRDDFRRDKRMRSPVRDYADAGYDRRSPRMDRPVRERSPPPLKRSRDVSPVGSRGRSPLPAPKRERLASPPPRASRYDEPRPRAYRYVYPLQSLFHSVISADRKIVRPVAHTRRPVIAAIARAPAHLSVTTIESIRTWIPGDAGRHRHREPQLTMLA